MFTKLTASALATPATAGAAILAYLDREYIQQIRLVVALGFSPDRLSRMLNDKGRYAGERLTSEIVERIADELDVPAAMRREWLSLIKPQEGAA